MNVDITDSLTNFFTEIVTASGTNRATGTTIKCLIHSSTLTVEIVVAEVSRKVTRKKRNLVVVSLQRSVTFHVLVEAQLLNVIYVDRRNCFTIKPSNKTGMKCGQQHCYRIASEQDSI